ncbi:MAG TPA: cytochrome c oxidase assembly protein [Thermohalobaculum sp.]|nr:cytochrome c oxidase assembly protein [Thermohalobaculum sp.]
MSGRATARDLRRKALPFFLVPFVMLGAAYASVPLYDLFCRVTGFGGTPRTAEVGSAEVLDQTITVRFDASTARTMPWRFKPVETTHEIRIGETGLAFYEAHNPTDRPITGTATFNVAPLSVGSYFVKIDCFCFVEQTLMPGETVEMPVTFYVDPEITRDPETKGVPEITLSYTFYETELGRQAALGPGAPGAGGAN